MKKNCPPGNDVYAAGRRAVALLKIFMRENSLRSDALRLRAEITALEKVFEQNPMPKGVRSDLMKTEDMER